MSSTALKIMALVTLVLAVGLGYVAYRMSQDITKPPAQTQASVSGAPAPTLAVVSIKSLNAYAPVPADAVALVPVAVLPEQYFSKLEEAVGRAPLSDVPTGTTLGPRYFSEANTLVRSIPPGFQAMSLEINDVIAVGGFVRPGDLVDVLLYIRSTGREVEDSQARILLREARVLAYEDRVLNDAEPSDGVQDDKARQQQKARRIRTAVLAVPEPDTTRVMLGASLGELRLSLRAAPPEEAPALEGVGEMLSVAEAEGELTPVQEPEDQVVTLRELSAIKKKQTSATPAAPASEVPPITVYRGSDVKHVNR